MKRFVGLTCLCIPAFVGLLLFACSDSDQSESQHGRSTEIVNPYLADSPWPMAHHDSYCQDATALRGPEPGDDLVVSFLPGSPVSVFMLYTPADSSGERAVWGSTAYQVYTIDANQTPLTTLSLHWELPDFRNLMSGAYTLLDRDGTLYSPRGTRIHTYGLQDPGDIRSPIVERSDFPIPGLGDDEGIIGINMTYDGRLVFATSLGHVGIMRRDFSDPQMLQLGDGDEKISNSFAVDEDGGIYIVTSKRMHRVQWTGKLLTQDEGQGAWSLPYDAGPQTLQPGRLSIGSGTTPTLMGSGDQDKLVAICDGQDLMNIVLYWRGAIPGDWQPIAPGKDRRIAAQMPVTFGDPSVTHTSTEQSPAAWGYDVAVVNNYYGPDAISGPFLPLISNLPKYAPYGVQKFTWDPMRQELVSAWANPVISCPNGVPSVSGGSGLMYCIGQRECAWTIEAIDWRTGESAFHVPLGLDLKYNSFWANTEIGPDRNVITGTFLGTLDIRPQ